jgi:hypothetical protein
MMEIMPAAISPTRQKAAVSLLFITNPDDDAVRTFSPNKGMM